MNGRDKGKGKRELGRHARRDGGFTVIELSIVLVIIAIIASLAFVTFGRAIKGGREAGERMFLLSLKTAVEQYKQDNGVLPPLLNDQLLVQGNVELQNAPPLNPTTKQPYVRSAAFLRNDEEPAAPRFSVYSLPYYLGGILNADADGIEGPGYTKVLDDGTFSRKGPKIEPLFDFGRDPARIRRRTVPDSTHAADEAVIVDRWGKVSSTSNWLPMNTIRYYRWEPKFYASGANAGKVQNYNVPPIIQLTSQQGVMSDEFRNFGFAILSKGPDGRVTDRPLTNTDVWNLDNLVEVGK